MKIPNRHEYPHRTAYIIAKYTVKEGTHRDVIKNIGAGGLFIKTSRKVSLGQAVALEFPLFQFDKIIKISGQVIRGDHDGFAVEFDKPLDGLDCKDGEFPEIVHESERASR
ncbi:PilZ domain-containing protein [uncultured Desulfosarcina sp.]|uniref:PilZ domain-containing protein n=1 Tax=uncultured Desulfosarcina sp. TaxID=218289 RepID=UPI0029C72CE2|nr:PilZ domain-containing protein [uncultured Desulfosarcina sp.]